MKRSSTAIAFPVLAFLGFAGWAIYRAVQIAEDFKANEELTDTAPQQTVAALWAIKDATIQTMLFAGITLAVLVVATVYLAVMSGRQDTEDRASQPEPPQVP
jgi:hypothetical protein